MAAKRSALGGYRVLDLAEEGSGLCGKLLGDCGAEVIKVEPPGGSHLRSIGPFYHHSPHPEKSLFWFAYNTSKKSITLNIETSDGQEMLRRLARSAHFLVESFAPGYLDDRRLGYSALSQVNPGLIMVSITHFGQTGPYSKLKTSNLVVNAMAGIMYDVGTPDRAPVCPMTCRDVSISSLTAELESAAGSLIANYHRLTTGEGQHIDVSIQECIAGLLLQPPNYWDLNRIILKRLGAARIRSARGVNVIRQTVHRCKDGYVAAQLYGEWLDPMVDWLDSEGAAQDLKTDREKWKARLALSADPPISQEEVDHLEKEVLGSFLARHTKAEIYEQSQARGIGWGGVCSIDEVVGNPQLKSRSFFADVNHPELGRAFDYPRPPYKASETPPMVPRRAPLIGEHNEEMYAGELGFTKAELTYLREGGVI